MQKVIFCNISNSSDYYTLTEILESGDWIFRGQENSKWLLTHSLERMWIAEDAYIKYIKKHDYLNFLTSKYQLRKNNKIKYEERCKKEYQAVQKYKALSHNLEMSNIEALCNLQHYEGKTRLLDFSFSINVALFFAFENKYIFKNQQCIWAINYKSLKDSLIEPFKKYCQDKGSSIDKIAKLPLPDFNEFLLGAQNDGALDLNEFDFRNLCNNAADHCITEKQQKVSHFDDKLLPIEMPGINPRLDAQNGLFIFATEMIPFSECLCKTFKLNINRKCKKRYPDLDEDNKRNIKLTGENEFKKNNEKISESSIIKIIFKQEFAFKEYDKKILKSANINACNIFPDATGIAKSIEYW